MLRILIIRMVVDASNNQASYFGVLEDGTVPERFFAYPNVNGTGIEDNCLIKVYPVMNVEGVETWGERNNAEEVSVWSSDDFQEKHMPKNVRWFVDKRPTEPPAKSMLKRHRLLNP